MHSSPLWLEKIAKAHSFVKPCLAKVQERLEWETLSEILGLMKF
jgi:hypothetical protein